MDTELVLTQNLAGRRLRMALLGAPVQNSIKRKAYAQQEMTLFSIRHSIKKYSLKVA